MPAEFGTFFREGTLSSVFFQDPSRMGDGFSDGQRKGSSGRISFPSESACPQRLGLLAPKLQVREALLRRQLCWRRLATGPHSLPALRATFRGLLLQTLAEGLADLGVRPRFLIRISVGP